MWTSLNRLYRLGLCGTLLALDVVLLLVFLLDLRGFLGNGYEPASLEIPPTGPELGRALWHASETSAFILVLLPLAVASLRILVTRLKLPIINWPFRRILAVHVLITLLIAVGIVACVRMEVASGLQFAFDSTHSVFIDQSFVYNPELERIPLALNHLVAQWLPHYLVSWHSLLLVLGLILSYMTGAKLLARQRQFFDEYMTAGKLADYDPTYLPQGLNRHVQCVKPCAPPTTAIQRSVARELDALNFGQDGVGVHHTLLVQHARRKVADYFCGDSGADVKVRILPNTLGCIYAAISNEDADSVIVLSSVNHPGINDPINSWLGRNRKVKVLGVDESHRLEAWAVQEEIFLQQLRLSFPEQSKAIVVIPVVSSATGQIFAVRSLCQKIRSWSAHAVIVQDCSFLNVSAGLNLMDLYGGDYLCLNISQWITCSESCGILVTKKWLLFDPDWEKQIACVPGNIRTLSAFNASLWHAFKPSFRLNDPKSRSAILMGKFCDVIDPRLVSVVEVPDLRDKTYFLTVEPAKGKNWEPHFAEKVTKMGLDAGLWKSDGKTRLTLAFPPYVDFWRCKSLAVSLCDSVVQSQ